MKRRANLAAFVLLEVMLGVAIFAIGVIALGRCMESCISAQTARAEDQRASRALENRMAEVEAGAIDIDDDKPVALEGRFEGLTMKQSRKPLPDQNEKKQNLTGLYEVELEVSWVSGNQPQSKALSFYVLRPQ